MNYDKEMFYNDPGGMGTNLHPINQLLTVEDKVRALCEFESIMQSVRYNHDNVEDGFRKIISLFNSPN